MTDIERYTLLNEGRMDPASDGDWIYHDEHVAALEAVKAELTDMQTANHAMTEDHAALKEAIISPWIHWSGGDFLPISPETKVYVQSRSGHIEGPTEARNWGGQDSCWKHTGGGGDIIAYTTVEQSTPTDQPERPLACPHCPARFNTYWECEAHIKSHPALVPSPALEANQQVNAAEVERLRFEGDLDKWMKIIGAGITGYQPEAYAVMDLACEELVKGRQVIETLRAENAKLMALIRWAHETLYEINPSNYDHGEVCKLNDASVEVILGLAPTLGETHGKSAEWWAARSATKGDAS